MLKDFHKEVIYEFLLDQNNQKYSKYKERLNELSTTLKVRTTDGKEYITSRNQETKDTYNIEINDYVEAYKSEFNL